MARHDPQTFNIIKDIILHHFEEFKNSKDHYVYDKKKCYKLKCESPLSLYFKEFGPIHKYSKKGNGPEIISMKYVDHKLGSHIDISSNYQVSNKKVILKKLSPYRTDFYLDDGVYKFVTVRYSNVFFSKNENKYCIDEKWYSNQLEAKKIKTSAKFLFSVHYNELIEITNANETSVYKFIGTNDDLNNVIEVKPIDYYANYQIRPVIGKKVTKIRKLACDALGNTYEITHSDLKLKFK